MKLILIPIAFMATAVMLSACDLNKKKAPEESVQTEWNCINDQHIKALELELKSEYFKQLDRELRESSYYEVDQALLKTINANLNFELKNIRTMSEDALSSTKLECEASLVVKLPKGLLQRAENAHKEQFEGELEGDGMMTLVDGFDEQYDIDINQNQLSGNFNYSLLKTDSDGIKLSAVKDNQVIYALLSVVRNAVLFEAYIKENKSLKTQHDQYDRKRQEQVQLAQKAMDLHKKELDAEKAKQVELLNLSWDGLDVEQQAQLKQDQARWFEKRNVDCKVLAQGDFEDKPMAQREVYQQHSQYWSEAMHNQNQLMQFDECFIRMTSERRVYLNHLFD